MVKSEDNLPKVRDERPSPEVAVSSLQQAAEIRTMDDLQPLASRDSTVTSGQEEEAVVYTQSRMLQDPTGRLRMSMHVLLRESLLTQQSIRWRFGDTVFSSTTSYDGGECCRTIALYKRSSPA